MQHLAIFSPTAMDKSKNAAEARADLVAVQLRNAMTGWGTNEESVMAALTGRSESERDEIKKAYRRLTNRELEADLHDELSGSVLEKALKLLNQGILSSEEEGFWSKLWGGIKSVAGTVWGGLKKAGGWIASGATWLWDKIKWVGKQIIDKVAGIFQRFAYWISQLPARIVRLLLGLWEGLKTFKPWTLSWWKSLADVDTWLNFAKWIGARVVELLDIVGVGEVSQTIADFIKFNTRILTESEFKAAKSVFGHSVNLEFVRVDEKAMIGPSISKRAYTSFHTINSWGHEKVHVMIHELTHVWQYENAGSIYMPQAIHAQAWGEGYDYGGAQGLQSRKMSGRGFSSFNREQQGQIVQDFFRIRQFGTVTDGPGAGSTSADLPLYADFVQAVSTLNRANLLTSI